MRKLSSNPPPARESAASRRGRLGRLGAALAASALLSTLLFGGSASGAAGSSYAPRSDGYSMANLTAQIGASAWWNAGYTGAGVEVAVIDTGVSAVPALSGAGKVVYGPDFSLEPHSAALAKLDGYGHGTFMAGLIAGHSPSLSAPYSRAPAGAYRGVAPDARIVSVKVGASDGAVEVSQVIAAIDWVVAHAHDPGFNIRVINLSYGTVAGESYTVDPLAYAAEQASRHGIVVVAAAGNTGDRRGTGAPGLADPAYDPYLIAVGGYDTNGTATVRDDSVGSYSASANDATARRPDLVAPGSHLQGLRVPGSYIAERNPQGLLGHDYLRGSGTSEATAITAGAVALILQRYPTLTPDQVKQFIEQDARKLPGAGELVQGSGELDLGAMLADAPRGFAKPPRLAAAALVAPLQPADPPTYALQGPPAPAPHYPDSRGAGSLEPSGAGGGIEILGRLFELGAGPGWSGNSWSGNSWSGNSWSGNSWSGNSWSGSSWASKEWN